MSLTQADMDRIDETPTIRNFPAVMSFAPVKAEARTRSRFPRREAVERRLELTAWEIAKGEREHGPESRAAEKWKPVAKALERPRQVGDKLAEARARAAELHAGVPAAEQRDREARGRAIADGRDAPRGPGETNRIAAELEAAQQDVRDLDTAAELVGRDLQELREANRSTWTRAQNRAVEQATSGILEATGQLAAKAYAVTAAGWVGGSRYVAGEADV